MRPRLFGTVGPDTLTHEQYALRLVEVKSCTVQADQATLNELPIAIDHVARSIPGAQVISQVISSPNRRAIGSPRNQRPTMLINGNVPLGTLFRKLQPFGHTYNLSVTPDPEPSPTANPKRLALLFTVTGMRCAGSCASRVVKIVQALEGTVDVSVTFEKKLLHVGVMPKSNPEELKSLIMTMVGALGFGIQPKKHRTMRFGIEGMYCKSCVFRIQLELEDWPEVVTPEVDLELKLLAVVLDDTCDDDAFVSKTVAAIAEMGFTATRLNTKAMYFPWPGSNEALLMQLNWSLFKQWSGAVTAMITQSPSHLRVTIYPVGGLSPNPTIEDVTQKVQENIPGLTCSLQEDIGEIMELDRCEAVETHTQDRLEPEEELDSFENDPLNPLTTEVPTHSQFLVTGMSCASCSAKIELTMKKNPHVKTCVVNFATCIARMEYDESQLSPREICTILNDLGFPATEYSATQASAENQNLRMSLQREEEITYCKRNLKIAVLFTLPLVILMLLENMHDATHDFVHRVAMGKMPILPVIQLIFATPVVVYCGRGFFRNAFRALSNRMTNMDVLVTLGVASAYLGSVYYMACTAIGLLHTGEYFFAPAAMLIAFMLLGRLLENVAKGKTTEALLRLIDLQPKRCIRLRKTQGKEVEEDIDVEILEKGDVVRVRAGEKIPIDGDVVHGSGSVDTSVVTGEHVPVYVTIGDAVSAGTINCDGLLHIKVSRLGEETTISQILKLVQEAQMSKPAIQAYADYISSIFVPSVVCIAIFTALVWFLLGYHNLYDIHWRMEAGTHTEEACLGPDFSKCIYIKTPGMFALQFFISVMVVACPCALGLATPTAVMVGTGQGASMGILIKGGDVLESAARISTVVFDKTGTLTKGMVDVVEYMNLSGNLDDAKLLPLIAGAEAQSTHPMAKAIVNYCKRFQDSSFITPDSLDNHPGEGISCVMSPAWAKGINLKVGSERFISKYAPLDQDARSCVDDLMRLGMGTVLASIDDKVVAIFGCVDGVKPEAKRVVSHLQNKMKLKVCMITGDNMNSAMTTARAVGIPPELVFANIMPGEKATIVQQLQRNINLVRKQDGEMHDMGRGTRSVVQVELEVDQASSTGNMSAGGVEWDDPLIEGGKGPKQTASILAMVGDGINDAPALANSDVGIALGAGTEVAMDCAKIVLARSNLEDVPATLSLAKATFRRIRLNFIWAFGYNIIAIPIAAGMMYPYTRFHLPPTAAGISMMFSSLTVLMCSLSLRVWSPKTIPAVYGDVDKGD